MALYHSFETECSFLSLLRQELVACSTRSVQHLQPTLLGTFSDQEVPERKEFQIEFRLLSKKIFWFKMVKRVEDSAVIKNMKPSVAVIEPLVKPSIGQPQSSGLHRPSSSRELDTLNSDMLHSPSSHSSRSSFFSSLRIRKTASGWFQDFTKAERTLSISLLFSIALLLFFFTIILLLVTSPKNKVTCKNFMDHLCCR